MPALGPRKPRENAPIETWQHDHERTRVRWGNGTFGMEIDVCLGCGLVCDDLEILGPGRSGGSDYDKVNDFNAELLPTSTFRDILRIFYEVNDAAPN